MSWSLLFFISEWIIRLVMAGVVLRRRRSSSNVAWLLVILFLPWPGLILYLLIGNDRLSRPRAEQYARALQENRSTLRRLDLRPFFLRPDEGYRFHAAVRVAERLGSMPILGGNEAELLTRADHTLDRLVADIDAACSHVHLLFYIFADDAVGRRVVAALIGAAERGVTCRVLLDAVGSRRALRSFARPLRNHNIQLLDALPASPFRRHVARLDVRNHRKLAVIDGAVAYTGSQNIVEPGYGRKDLSWHDLMVRVTGPVVQELQSVFLGDWLFRTSEKLDSASLFPAPDASGYLAVQALPSGPNYPTENYQRMVVALVHAARERVVVTTPYFVPDDPFMQALETAVLRGVQVDVILPRRFDQLLAGAATQAYYDDLLAAGVRVFRYSAGLLHAKTMSIDNDVALIGTSNFDIRSFMLNFEITMVFYGAAMAGMLREAQDRYRAGSEQLDRIVWQARPRISKVGQNTAKLLSPLL